MLRGASFEDGVEGLVAPRAGAPVAPRHLARQSRAERHRASPSESSIADSPWAFAIMSGKYRWRISKEMANRNVTVGLLHPGEMGVTVGATVVAGGTRVVWASEGRSALTESRALEAGLEDGGSLALVVRQSRVILSVVPPHGALALAQAVAALDFRGLYVDGNAVSPETAREIGWVIESAGGRFVDGGIIGPAARKRGTTRLYLSGSAAPEIAVLFNAGPMDAVVLDAPAGAASALKMAYAGWTKGSAALLAPI